MKRLGILICVIVFTFVSSITTSAANITEYQQETNGGLEEKQDEAYVGSEKNNDEGDRDLEDAMEIDEDADELNTETKSAKNEKISPQSDETSTVAISLTSSPASSDSYSGECKIGDTIGYNIRLRNNSDSEAVNVSARLNLMDGLTPLPEEAQYYVGIKSSNAVSIEGAAGYTMSILDNGVVFSADSIAPREDLHFTIECEASAPEQTVRVTASLLSANGETYSSIESGATSHKIYYEASRFEVTAIATSDEYLDTSKSFTYDLKLTKNGANFSGSFPYTKTWVGDEEESGELEVIDGSAAFSLQMGRTLAIAKMPTGLSYEISQREADGYTPDRALITGVTSLTPTSLNFTNSYDYIPVDYSIETDIVASIKGREFKDGDSFSYKITPESKDTPGMQGYTRESSDDPIELVDMDTFTITPSSGYTSPYSLKAVQKTEFGIHCFGCDKYFYSITEFSLHKLNLSCFGSYEVTRHMFNVSPHMTFCYPGDYDYIVEQEKYEAADGGIVPDDSLYKLTVTVTAGEGNRLSATLSSVQKSIDSGSSWSVVPDKAQLIFTNTWSDAGPRITLNKVILDLEKGSTETLTAELDNMDAGSTITWTSSNEAVAAVNDGAVTAVGGGSATITAMAGGVKAFCEVNVKVPMTGISISNKNVEVIKGKALQLKMLYEPADTTDGKAVIWTSSDEEIAVVDRDTGLVTGVKSGEAEITATTAQTENPLTAAVKVTVVEKHITDALGGQIVFESFEQLLKGQSVSMKEFLNIDRVLEDNQITDIYSIEWTSSDNKIVTVDQAGRAVGVKEGKAAIEAVISFKDGNGSITGEYPVTTEIEVKEIALDSIAFDKVIKEMLVGATDTLHVIYNPDNTTDLREVLWESSDSDIISVENGKLTALKAGEAEITATVGSKKASCRITVKKGTAVPDKNQTGTINTNANTNTNAGNVNTGDNTNVILYLVMLLVSLIIIFLVYLKKFLTHTA